MVGSGLLALHLAFAIARPLRRSEAGAKPSAPDERCQHGDGATVYHFEFQNKGCQTTHLGHTGARF